MPYAVLDRLRLPYRIDIPPRVRVNARDAFPDQLEPRIQDDKLSGAIHNWAASTLSICVA